MGKWFLQNVIISPSWEGGGVRNLAEYLGRKFQRHKRIRNTRKINRVLLEVVTNSRTFTCVITWFIAKVFYFSQDYNY